MEKSHQPISFLFIQIMHSKMEPFLEKHHFLNKQSIDEVNNVLETQMFPLLRIKANVIHWLLIICLLIRFIS